MANGNAYEKKVNQRETKNKGENSCTKKLSLKMCN